MGQPRTPRFKSTTGESNPATLADKFNRAFASKTGLVVGDGIIEASNIGSNVHLRLKVQNLLPLIPKVEAFLKFVWLDHLGDGVYNAYGKEDPDFESDPVGTSLQPAYRPFGTSIDFTQYAEIGIGYFNTDGDFVLLFAIEERYDLGPCPPAP